MMGRFPVRYGERIGFEGGVVYARVPENLWNPEELNFFREVLRREEKISVLGDLPVVFAKDREIEEWEKIARKHGVEYVSLC